jgi:Phosphoesterase family
VTRHLAPLAERHLDPAFDDCSDASHTSTSPVGVMTGKNIGDLLNARHVTWGWFQGGFAPTSTNKAGFAVCGASHQNVGGAAVADYSPHHNPFEYYKSTANPKHCRRPRRLPSAAPTRPTTSTTCPTSSPR